jgi:hypothetical protein
VEVHACNPRYSGGRGRRSSSSRLELAFAQAKTARKTLSQKQNLKIIFKKTFFYKCNHCPKSPPLTCKGILLAFPSHSQQIAPSVTCVLSFNKHMVKFPSLHPSGPM